MVSQAEQHRRLMQEALNDEIANHPDRDGDRHLSNRTCWERIPAFQFAPVQPWRLLRASAVILAWMILAAQLLSYSPTRWPSLS